MYTNEMTNAIVPTNWFYILHVPSQIEVASNLHSTLEIAFHWIAVHLFRYLIHRLL